MDVDAQMESLRALSPRATLLQEGGAPWILLPEARVQTANGIEVMDIVLCPAGHGGYATRLLLERRVATGTSLNWTEIVALGRTWHTWSWREVPADQPWIKILIEHARLLR